MFSVSIRRLLGSRVDPLQLLVVLTLELGPNSFDDGLIVRHTSKAYSSHRVLYPFGYFSEASRSGNSKNSFRSQTMA